MKFRNQLYLIIVVSTLTISCDNYLIRERGNGVIVSENRQVKDFSQIQFAGAYEVFLTPGTEPQVIVETDENLQEFIEVDQHNKRLIITTTDRIKSREGIKVYVTYTKINGIEVGGVASIESDKTIVTDYLELEMSGAGAVDLDLEVKELDLRVSGAGSIKLSGRTDKQSIRMSGAGDLEAYDLVSQYCKIDLAGIGSAQIYVKDELEASVSGVGGISYKGNPRRVRDDVSGLGKISDRGL